MRDEDRTREQLLEEVRSLRTRLEQVSEHRQPEAARQERHALLRAVVEGIPQAIYVKDRDGRYLLANSTAARLIGKSVEEMVGRDDTAWFDPETARRVREADRRVMQSGEVETYEHVNRTAAGVTRTYFTTKAPYRGTHGELLGVLGISRDITERKQAEEELARQKEVLQTIFDHIPVMIAFLDPAGRVRLANRRWEQALGWSLEEARNLDILAEFYPDPEHRRHALEYILHPPPGWADFTVRVRDGRTLDTSWANVLLSDGTSIGFGLDVTERKQAEQALERYTARLETLSRRLVEVQEEERRHLARELHDDIGQLLTSVKFAVEASAAAPPETAGAKMDEARGLLDEALARVRGLSFALRPALLDHLGLLPGLRSLIERYTAGTGVRVNFKHAGLEQRFEPDLETAAYRIVQEALTNVARHAGVTDAVVRVWAYNDHLEVQVEDEGVGFDPEATLAAGRSNGLPGIRERVMLLGGRLLIESARGIGTHLSASLPARPGRK